MRTSTLILLACFFVSLSSFSQERNNFSIGLNGGISLPVKGIGYKSEINLKYNLLSNVHIGVACGLNQQWKNYDYSSDSTYTACRSIMNWGMIFGDLYFTKLSPKIKPFIGVGIGQFNITNSQFNETTTKSGLTNALYKSFQKTGSMVHWGIELKKMRITFEYLLIPNTFINDLTGKSIGTISNNHFNITLGGYLGGGSWK